MLLAENTVPHVWHFWLAVPLAASAVLLVVVLLGLYARMVVRSRYPRQQDT